MNLTFGEALEFTIIEVEDNSSFTVTEKRIALPEQRSDCGTGRGNGCGSGCNNGGCAGGEGELQKVTLVSDCRCILCKRIGFQVQKQLEKRAVIGFDVECSIEDAIRNVIRYFERVDHHKTLRGFAHGKEDNV